LIHSHKALLNTFFVFDLMEIPPELVMYPSFPHLLASFFWILGNLTPIPRDNAPADGSQSLIYSSNELFNIFYIFDLREITPELMMYPCFPPTLAG
jgi:hypothetical protein